LLAENNSDLLKMEGEEVASNQQIIEEEKRDSNTQLENISPQEVPEQSLNHIIE
jgi:hypothetical protein